MTATFRTTSLTFASFLHVGAVVGTRQHGHRVAAVLSGEAVLKTPGHRVVEYVERKLWDEQNSINKTWQHKAAIFLREKVTFAQQFHAVMTGHLPNAELLLLAARWLNCSKYDLFRCKFPVDVGQKSESCSPCRHCGSSVVKRLKSKRLFVLSYLINVSVIWGFPPLLFSVSSGSVRADRRKWRHDRRWPMTAARWNILILWLLIMFKDN